MVKSISQQYLVNNKDLREKEEAAQTLRSKVQAFKENPNNNEPEKATTEIKK